MPNDTIYYTSDHDSTELMQSLPDLPNAPASPAISFRTKLVSVIHGDLAALCRKGDRQNEDMRITGQPCSSFLCIPHAATPVVSGLYINAANLIG